MFEIGTATDHHDLAAKLDTFLKTNGSAFAITYAGTGTGTITAYRGGASSVAESWELTATSATNFTVVGSVSGSIGPATVGTPFSHAKIAFTLNAGGTAFVSGDKFSLATAPKWTQMLGPNAATSTQWRIAFTRNGAGSSGLLRMARVEMMLTAGGADQIAGSGGTADASSVNSTNVAANAADTDNSTFFECGNNTGWWRYTFGSTKAVVEVAITASVASPTIGPGDFTVEYWSGSAWVPVASFVNESGWGVSERRVFRLNPYIWKAPGNDGTRSIYVGVHPFQNAVGGWYNWRLSGMTAFVAGTDFFLQAGALKRLAVSGTDHTYGPSLPLSNGSLGYWFVCNGNRVMGVVKSGSNYSPFYLGLIQPYASPGNWPLPLYVGGSLWWSTEPSSALTTWGIGSSHERHTCFALPISPVDSAAEDGTHGSGMLRKPDGSWLALFARSSFYDVKEEMKGLIWPYAFGMLALKPDLDGVYSLMPIMLIERAPNNIYGQFDGVQAVTGSSLSAEADVNVGKDRWIAFPDVNRATAGDFFAMKMD